MALPGSNGQEQLARLELRQDRDFIDVDERGEQALRNSYWDGKAEKKPLNSEQGPGDYVTG